MDGSDLNSYVQLVQDIICGTVRRHTFTPLELNLLLDIRELRMRKAAKTELLRRYLRTVQQESLAAASVPLRLAHFCENEKRTGRLEPAEATNGLLCMTTATPA